MDGTEIITDAAVVGLTGLIVQGAKMAGLDSRYAMLVSVLVAIVLTGLRAVALSGAAVSLQTVAVWIWSGLAAGLVMSGAYSGVKALSARGA